MSDFFHSGWSLFVAAGTVLSLLFCLFVLLVAARRREMASDNTTGHVWDEDLREMNNPLPRWWLWLFVITVVFSAIYLALYPGLGSLAGSLKWTSEGQHAAEIAKTRASMAPLYAQFTGQSAEALAGNEQAMGIGQRLYLNNCAQCHGSDARGSKGFPNLTDSDWLYGGSHETIIATLTNGRQGNMPALGAALGGAAEVRNVAHYVLSLSGSPHNDVAAQLGKAKYTVCAACHGADGQGNPALGAPNLTDKVWLHGGSLAAISEQIDKGRNNLMPAHKEFLGPERSKILAGYVWSLSQAPAAAK